MPLTRFDFKDKLEKLAPKGKRWILDGIIENFDLFDKYEILPGNRLEMFLAQIAHESDGFNTTQEYASGRAYEGRRDLGNIIAGDGPRFKGRGLIQLTGRANYRRIGELLNQPLEDTPEIVAKFPLALEVSCLFWKNAGLNFLADKEDFKKITQRINGGFNGWEDRMKWLEKAQEICFCGD